MPKQLTINIFRALDASKEALDTLEEYFTRKHEGLDPKPEETMLMAAGILLHGMCQISETGATPRDVIAIAEQALGERSGKEHKIGIEPYLRGGGNN